MGCVETQGRGADSETGTGEHRVRVLLVGHQFQVPSEGQAKAAALACRQGLEVHTLTPRRYREGGVAWRTPRVPEAASYGFHVAGVRWPWAGPAKWYLQSYRDLARILRTINPHIIDVWEEPWNLLSAQICRVRAQLLPQAKLISETEQNVSKNLPFPFEQIRRYTLRSADFLIGRNREALEVAYTKGYAGPARVVGNGVDTRHFSPASKADALSPQNAGPGGRSGWVVGYAGRLVQEKGLETLLAAIATLQVPCRLRVCGDGPLRETLVCSPAVEWLGDLPREDLREFYRSLDVLVLPSRTTARWKEQFGRVLIEAQACGVPVVGSSSGAIPEVIGTAGWVFPEGDADALAAVLKEIFSDENRRKSVASAGHAQVLERYGWDSIARQMEAVYRTLCPEGGVSGVRDTAADIFRGCAK